MAKSISQPNREAVLPGAGDSEDLSAAGERSNATKHAYIELKRLIHEGRLQPGRTFLQQALAEMLNVSRTPVREAVIRLAEDGLVEIRPRYGVYIRPFTLHELKETYDVLAALESYSAMRAATRKLSPSAEQRLASHHKAMEAAAATKDVGGWIKADEAFHKEIATESGNTHLGSIVSGLWERLSRARLLTTPMRSISLQSNAEHASILSAIAKGEDRKAFDLMSQHRERAAIEMIDSLRCRGVSEL